MISTDILQALADVDRLCDCGDHSCFFAKNKAGMRTNGHCRCGDHGLRLGALSRLVKAVRAEATKKDQDQ